jgi:hypothetical protein
LRRVIYARSPATAPGFVLSRGCAVAWHTDLEQQPDSTVHVWPEVDAVPHHLGQGELCVCGPRLEEQANGTVLVVHHQLSPQPE